MNFLPYGPVRLPRDDEGLLLLDSQTRREFWDKADELDQGLSEACGCYVFAVKTGKVAKPWYVGKAERQPFKRECLTEHKVNKYNSILQSSARGIPCLYLYARVTAAYQNFSKPTTSQYRDIPYLEKMLIGAALGKNKDLLNIQETKLLKEMYVPGLINTGKGRPSPAMQELKYVMGY
ncbi:MAG: hypothetical protein AB7H90_08175 [Alphaproteobacteria bacterium]